MTHVQNAVPHHFTVDVEEYFQVSALEPWAPRSRWTSFESRVTHSTLQLAQLLGSRGMRGTFFILGWVAERNPDLIRELAAGGHEIASHGWDHRRVTQQNMQDFRVSVRDSKRFLEDITGEAVIGYRAPSFSIIPGLEWALDVLIEEGYRYDSSLFPIARRGYGYAGGARDPHWIQRPAGQLAEIPPATLRKFGWNLPAAGGAYLRLLPLALIRSALSDAERRGVPATFYIHPWELDPNQPRLTNSLLTRVRHYGGLKRTINRIERLLAEFSFQPIAETVAKLQANRTRAVSLSLPH